MSTPKAQPALAASAGSARRRLQLNGSPAVLLADDKSVSRYLAPMQPRWKERDAKSKVYRLLDWFSNQGQRSRLISRGGFTVGRVDCLRPNTH
jgi:hypothetical protein